jgi:hypothetical protein
MTETLNINGKLYRLVEEDKKPERLSGWIDKEHYIRNYMTAITDGKDKFKDTRMIEIRDNETIVSRDDFLKLWGNAGYVGYPESLLKELGL